MGEAFISGYERYLEEATKAPLSKCLPAVLKLALQIGNKDLEKWARLEIDGYYATNPALDDEVVVPEYRTISGQFIDAYGRPLIIRDPELRFINEDRLRNGVAELESLARSTGMLSYESPQAETINRHLKVNVSKFQFHPSAIDGVLSGIRSELIQRMHRIGTEIQNTSPSSLFATHSRKRPKTRFFVGIILLVVLLFTLTVFSISYFVQPILPPALNNIALLLVASLLGVIGFVAALNEVVEFFQKLFHRDSSGTQDWQQ